MKDMVSYTQEDNKHDEKPMKKRYHTRRYTRKVAAGLVILTTLAALGIPGIITAHFAKASTMAQDATSTPEAVIQHPEPEIAPEPATVSHRPVPVPTSALPSQHQKDTTAALCRERFSGAELSQCYVDILAIAYAESRFHLEAVGDEGKSWGPFQIYTKVHTTVTWEQATDYEWAARWTLNRIVSKGYPTNRTFAIQAHNGLTYDQNGELIVVYANSVKATAQRFLDQGL